MPHTSTHTHAADAGLSLVAGVDGNIGHALYQRLIELGRPVVGTTRRAIHTDNADHAGRLIPLDLAQSPDTWNIPAGVTIAYLCAGVAVIDQCRLQPEATRRVNCDGTIALAQMLAARGVKVVYLSTNQVFDGSISHRRAGDAPCPITEYGRQKATTEQAIAQLGDKGVIVRLTKVLPPAAPLLAGWKNALQAGQSVTPFHDMRMAPVSRDLVVQTLLRIADHPSPLPVVHVSGSEDVTYEQAARFIARQIGAAESLIHPISARSAGLPVEATPLHTTLETTSLQSLGLDAPSPWDAIAQAM